MPEWRNGSRAGLRILWPQGRVGSTPTSGTYMTKRTFGVCALALFLLSIPFANWWLERHGLWDMPLVGNVPSAVWVVGAAFVVRDIVEITLGRKWTWVAIFLGTVLSWWLASPKLAIASGTAFLWSEGTDALVFAPLADRGRFLLGVLISGYVASIVDSAIFVRLAFDSFDGWWQLTVAKIFFVAVATPVAWSVRRALSRPALHGAYS